MNNKTILTFFALVFTASAGLFAQHNYTIKMQMKIEGLPPEYAAMGEQEIITYIRENQQKTEVTGMLGSMLVFYDGKKMTSLSDQMGKKTGFTATKEELEAEDKNKKPEAKPKIEYTNDKKTIAGFVCSKAIVTNINKDKQTEKTIVWYTEEIKTDQAHSGKSTRGMVDLGDLKGYPLGMEMSNSNNGHEMKSTIIASEVTKGPIDDSVFVVNTAGYTMMPYKEMKELQKTSLMGR